MTAQAAGRRARFTAIAAALLVAATACAVLLNIIAAARPVRFDTTAAGEHRLSPRTLRVLAALPADCRIVAAVPFRGLDPGAVERVQDVLDQLGRASARVRTILIDTGAPGGAAQYASLLRELSARDHALIESQTAAIRAAVSTLNDLATDFENIISAVLLKVRGGIPESSPAAAAQREAFEQRAAGARIIARDLRRAASEAEEALSARIADLPAPATDRAAATVAAALGSAADQLASLAVDLKAFADSDAAPSAARDTARPLVAALSARRDSTAVLRDQLSRLPRPDLLRVADALRASNAVLVISDAGGITAIDPGQLFPPSLALNASGLARADLRRRAEELFSTAIATLSRPDRPILVFLHAETREAALRSPVFTALQDRLRRRGMDLLEWPVALRADPPALTSLDPDRRRPIVYVTIAPNTASGSGGPGEASGPERAAKLGQALETLANQGASILLSINPSLLPGYGQPDPTTSILPLFGLQADSARPVLRERLTPQGRVLETDQVIRPPAGEHPILRAIAGLPTYFTWPIPFSRAADPPPGSTVTELASIPADDSLWSESQWLRVWQTPPEQLPYLRDLPVFDEGRDARGGPWPVAVAAERPGPEGRPQRLVAVGSNRWFTDAVAAIEQPVEGRLFNPFPGNAELFESAVLWLCGQDELIAQTPAARAFPMVSDLAPARLSLLRWAIVAGVPVLVLLLGALHRVVHG